MSRVVGLTNNDWEEAVLLLSESFCGSTRAAPEGVLSWAFGLWDIDENDDDADCYSPLRKEPSTQRLAFFTWNARFTLAKCMEAGKIFGVRENGTLLGICCCVEPESSASDIGKIDRAAAERAGIPPWLPSQSQVAVYESTWRQVRRRMAATAATTQSIHHDSVTSPHWYLANLAVLPAAQGKGVGKELLNYLHGLCDSQQMPCYLETLGARNEFIYQKAGYDCVVKRIIDPGKGMKPCQENGGVAGMVRYPSLMSKL